MKTCATCKRWVGVYDLHECPPEWLIWCPETGDEEDAKPVRAHDAESAAVEFAERWDARSDYVILGGSETVFHVKGRGEVYRFAVAGESVPQYTARMIQGKEEA